MRHRQKFLKARLSFFLLLQYDRMREKEQVMKGFYSTFDSSVLDKRRRLRCRLHRARGEAHGGSSSCPHGVKEERAEELSLDLENRRYNFYYRPNTGGN